MIGNSSYHFSLDSLVNMRPKNLKELGRVPGFAAKK